MVCSESRKKARQKWNEKVHPAIDCVICSHRFKKRGPSNACSDACVFWTHVEKKGLDECWMWTSTTTKAGYGKCRVDGRTWLAHRYSYVLHKGELLGKLQVMHSCDVPGCVNPNHLSLGTAKDNSQDMVKKGRASKRWLGHKHTESAKKKMSDARFANPPDKKGIKHHLCKFSESDVHEMRRMHAQGINQTDIAAAFRCAQSNVSLIVRLKRWSHI